MKERIHRRISEARPLSGEHVCPLLSVAMVNYNNVGFLESCLQSVMANTTGLRHEIIVVDNHSSDGSVKLVKQQFPRVRLIANQRNAGYGRAINQAVAVARGEFVLILNEDTILLPGAITKTLGFMRARSDAGIVGCRILNPDRSLQGSCRSFPSVWNYASENFFWDRLFPRSRIFGRPYMSYFSYDEVREVDVVLGAFMMVRRNLI
ncbi:MAG TPA: glycosyltransferase family 2 protein, partial [bacterium]